MEGGSGRHGRATVAEAAEQQGWPPSNPRTPPTVRDGRVMTVLRAVTYVLVSLVCLLLLAAVAYGAVQLNRVRAALPPSGDPVPVIGSGDEQFRYACEQGIVPAEQCGG